jgi:heat-inducible transcriptional repressor
MSDAKVNQRAQHILKILVERYIQDGFPIGSKTIAEEYALGLSSASIRNILADLEESGYLSSPHTSAGRIPTELGYRFFVNSLLTTHPFANGELADLKSKLNPDQDISHLVQSASSVLSGLTQLIGVVALPRRNRIELRQVEFLPLSGNRVLVILVLNNREVQNRIIYTDRIYNQSELQQTANYLNSHYAGKELLTARKELHQAMQQDRDSMAKLLEAVVDVADKAFNTSLDDTKNYVIAGERHLLPAKNQQDDLERLSVLFNAFTQKQEILNLLDHALEAEGVQIFIGKESGYETFDNCSVVTASYSVDGQLVGSLGVIGPTRMPYDRVISAVDVTAKLLSAALNQG